METHVKVLAVLHIVFGAMGLLGGLVILLIFSAGAATAAAAVASDPNARFALPLIGLAGTALSIFLIAISLPGIVAGIGLLGYRPWARIVAIVLSAINLINIPFGTILGLYGLYVLLSDAGARLFEVPPPAAAQP